MGWAAFGFDFPWMLALLGLLPLLWHLLRLVPPRPRRVRFPALMLLKELATEDRTPATMPPWLLALRLGLLAVLILAAAGPVLDPARTSGGSGALAVVVDNGWASAPDWRARAQALDDLLAQAERDGRAVLLAPTAPAPDGGAMAPPTLLAASQARAQAAQWAPRPWPTDRGAVLAALQTLPDTEIGRAVWLSDGLGGEGAADLARWLQSRAGGLELRRGLSAHLLRLGADLSVQVIRAQTDQAEPLTILGRDAGGVVLVRMPITLAAGTRGAQATLDLPAALRNRLARVEIEGEAGAGAMALVDESARRRVVGLATGAGATGSALLDPLYYLDRALSPHAELRRLDPAQAAAQSDLSVLILADLPLAPGALADRLAARVQEGLVLVRFAGPLMAAAAAKGGVDTDPLLAVPLLGGGRTLGGVMSWSKPQTLAAFAETGPFAGLEPSSEVTVSSQVLAQAGAEQTWASLADGTPLVTGRRLGRGWLVQVHTGANADWSNLALSGLFVDMTRRLVALSQGQPLAAPAALAPIRVLDGFGQLAAPSPAVQPLAADAALGPRQPPGLYGAPEAPFARNLGVLLGDPRPMAALPGVTLAGLEAANRSLSLMPALLVAALLLLLADGAVSLRLAVILLVLAAPQAGAAEPKGIEAALSTRLACLATGDEAVDRDCIAGLAGLSRVVADRSTARLAPPVLVAADSGALAAFPVLYWRMSPRQVPLSPAAAQALGAYMAQGGLLVIDTAGEVDRARLRALLGELAVPPLVAVAPDHVLMRSFYLLKDIPGRWDGTELWVQDMGGRGLDGVSGIVVGANDWVAAWAVDGQGRPLHALVPGTERQRELAYRFGVNLVMYAFTGNYKADQVHLPAIMERLGR
jgi:hypothetical protein